MTFTARYLGRCGCCSRPIRPGDVVDELKPARSVNHYGRSVRCKYGHEKCIRAERKDEAS